MPAILRVWRRGKDLLDVSEHLQLTQSDVVELPPDIWTPLRFDQQVYPEGVERGNWRQVLPPNPSHEMDVSGDVIVNLQTPVGCVELRALAIGDTARELGPAVAFDGGILDCQLAVHAHLFKNESLVIVGRPSEAVEVNCTFSGFYTER